MKGFIRRGGIVAAVLCMCLTGCGTSMVELTPEEENLIVAYASGTVAKANKYMEQGLTYPKAEEETEEPKEEEQSEENNQSSEAGQNQMSAEPGSTEQQGGEADVPQENAQEATMTEALQLESVTAEYYGYEVRNNYVEGSYFALNAETGMTYLILNVGLVNTSQQPIECNLFNKDIRCSLYINQEQITDSMATVLLNDFTTYIGTLEAAAKTDTVIIFEVSENAVQQIQSLSMDMEVDGSVYHVTLE